MSDETTIQPLINKAKGQLEWLREKHPEVFTEQRHLDEPSVERAYWHYGYLASLRDTLKFLMGSDPLL